MSECDHLWGAHAKNPSRIYCPLCGMQAPRNDQATTISELEKTVKTLSDALTRLMQISSPPCTRQHSQHCTHETTVFTTKDDAAINDHQAELASRHARMVLNHKLPDLHEYREAFSQAENALALIKR